MNYYPWFILFVIVGYFIATDESVAYAVILISKIIRFEYEKRKWLLLHNPRNPIVKYLMWRKALRLAKELEKELKK